MINIMTMKKRPRFAKLFSLGYSQAVRLPVDMRLDCSRVRVHKVGEAVILESINNRPRIKNIEKWFADLGRRDS